MITISDTLRNLLSFNRPAGSGTKAHHRDAESLLEQLNNVVFKTDEKGLFRYLTKHWTALSGFNVNETYATSHLRYIHPNDQCRCEGFFGALGLGRAQPPITVRYLRKDGSPIWVKIDAASYYASNGQSEGVVGTLTDVTDQIQEQNINLTNNRSAFTILNNLPGMAFRGRNNRDWTMEYVSDGCKELTGHIPNDLINNHKLSYESLIIRDDAQRIWTGIQCALDEHRPWDLIYRITTAQDQKKWVWERGMGIFSSGDELLYLEGFITDITLAKIADQQLRNTTLKNIDSNLPSTYALLDRLIAAIQRAKSDEQYHFSLMLLSIDRIYSLMKSYGPQSCDEICQEVGRRLSELLGEGSIISRSNIHQFAILVEHNRGKIDTQEITHRIRDRFLSPIHIDKSKIYLNTSIGITHSQFGYDRMEDVLRDAETAVSHAAALGGGQDQTFDQWLYEVSDLHHL